MLAAVRIKNRDAKEPRRTSRIRLENTGIGEGGSENRGVRLRARQRRLDGPPARRAVRRSGLRESSIRARRSRRVGRSPRYRGGRAGISPDVGILAETARSLPNGLDRCSGWDESRGRGPSSLITNRDFCRRHNGLEDSDHAGLGSTGEGVGVPLPRGQSEHGTQDQPLPRRGGRLFRRLFGD